MSPEELHCPSCSSHQRQVKDGFTRYGSQRYRCRACNYRYTPKPKDHGYDEEVRLQALMLHLEGMSMRQIAGLLEVSHQSVANWVKDYGRYLPPDLPASIGDTALLDELMSL